MDILFFMRIIVFTVRFLNLCHIPLVKMVLNEIGRVVVKTAGRDAGKKAVIVDTLDKNHVLIDGATRRRKCNIAHLEPLEKVIKIEKNASHEDVTKAFKEIGLETRVTKPKESKERPKKSRKSKEKAAPSKGKEIEKKSSEKEIVEKKAVKK